MRPRIYTTHILSPLKLPKIVVEKGRMQVLLGGSTKAIVVLYFNAPSVQQSRSSRRARSCVALRNASCVRPFKTAATAVTLPHSTLEAVSVSGLIRDLISGDVCYCSAEDASDITPANSILHSVPQDRVDCATLIDTHGTVLQKYKISFNSVQPPTTL